MAAVQPKAAGSSLLAKLANALALDALKEAGLVEFGELSSCPARRACRYPCACSRCGISSRRRNEPRSRRHCGAASTRSRALKVYY